MRWRDLRRSKNVQDRRGRGARRVGGGAAIGGGGVLDVMGLAGRVERRRKTPSETCQEQM